MNRKELDLRDISVSAKYMEIYGCKSNPFPVTGVTHADLGFPPTDSKSVEEIMAFIRSTYDRKQYGGLLIIGDYGFGKTYILRHVERRINEALYYRGTDSACAIYIENPEPPAIEDFITKFLDRFGMHRFLTLLWHLVSERFQNHLIKDGKAFLKHFFPEVSPGALFREEHTAGDIAAREDIFTNPFKFLDWFYESKADLNKLGEFAEREILQPIFQHPEVTKALSSLDNYSSSDSYRNWMSVLNYRMFKKSLRREIDPASFFRSILTVFRMNGFRHIYILVDEFEDVFSRTNKKERLDYCASLRNIIEFNLEYFSMILAVKPDAWHSITADMPAFADRFARKVELLGLTKEELATMIADYLSSVRDEDNCDYGTTRPFDDGAIEEIYKITHANHRGAVEVCFVLFEYASENGEKIITREMVRNIPRIRESLVKARRNTIEL